MRAFAPRVAAVVAVGMLCGAGWVAAQEQAPRRAQRAEGERSQDAWYPSKYGKDDTLGAVNNLSPAGVLAAAKLVKTGKVYALGVTTGPATPAYGTRSFQIFTQPG